MLIKTLQASAQEVMENIHQPLPESTIKYQVLINSFFPSACSYHPFALLAEMTSEGLVCWALTSTKGSS